MNLESKEELYVKYIINSDSDIDLTFSVFDSDENLISEKSGGGNGEQEITLDLLDAENGMLKIVVSGAGKETLVEESFLYDRNALTGFVALSDMGSGSYIIVIVIVFLIIAFFLVRRILKLKKKHKGKK